MTKFKSSKSTPQIQFLKDMPGYEIVPGFTERFVHGKQVTLSFVDIKKGSRLPEHQHIHEQISHVVEGEIEMVIGNETIILLDQYILFLPTYHILHTH